MGESELVLDSLTVDEALRIVGGRAAEPIAEPSDDVEIRPPRTAVPPEADWRKLLRDAGGEPAPRDATVRRLPPRETDVTPPPPSSPRAAPQPSQALQPSQPLQPAAIDLTADIPTGIVVGSNARELFGGPMAHLASIDEIAHAVHECRRCQLFATATRGVPGEGPDNAELMIVGEAPGGTEDETGRPFVGPAGQLLTKILAAVDLQREDVFICNVLKHRPPGNRNPIPDEVAACSPYLVRQIELIKPKLILALGSFAAQTLLATKLSIGKLRGMVHRYHGVPLIVTYHPAALLRNPGWKRPTWEDVQLARRVLDRAPRGA